MKAHVTKSFSEDTPWDIQESLTDSVNSGGGKKSKSQGKKTVRAVIESQKENAGKNRKIEAKLNLINDLKHFPVKNLKEEQVHEAVNFYTEWVIKSLEHVYPSISNLDDEIRYSQTRSSGPGGQNVNKVSTAVVAKHLLTGISARSDGRDMLVNKRESLEKVMRRLEKHIDNWRVYLEVPSNKRADEIKNFIYSEILK